MSKINTELLKSSFEAIAPYADEAIERFCHTLSERHPEAKIVFEQLAQPEQRKSLERSLQYIVENVSDSEKLKPYLKAFSLRQTEVGAGPEHYSWVSECMLETFAYYFDNTWTPELEMTWQTALTTVGEIITELPDQAVVEIQANERTAEVAVNHIETAIKDIVRTCMDEVMKDDEILGLARARARLVLQQALEKELEDMRQQLNKRKVA